MIMRYINSHLHLQIHIYIYNWRCNKRQFVKKPLHLPCCKNL